MMGSNECHLKMFATDQNRSRKKGRELPIVDFGTRVIVFDLTNVTKCIINQIDPFIGKRESSVTFMANRNILVGIKADIVKFRKMNRRIIFKARGKT